MTKPTLYLIFHGRFPSEKAAALFAFTSAASFAKHMPSVLLVPRRLKRDKPLPLPPGVRAVYLPTVDFFQVPLLERIAFPISTIVFSLSCLVYFFVQLKGDDVIDTNEPLPALAASLLTRNIVFEVHDFPERFRLFYALLFRRVRTVLSTNTWKKDELIKRFSLPEAKVLLERNGVDLEQFAPQEKLYARRALNLSLSQEKKVVVYTGHLYGWKGVETLAEAAVLLPDVSFYVVGGAPQDVAQFVERYPASNIHAVGYRPHDEIPLWQAASDVLVLPNTGKEEISARYTSPMKLFEYMASERPIVASNIPSIAEVLTEENSYLVSPDDSHALAQGIETALAQSDGSNRKVVAARTLITHHSWENRAKRIFARLSDASEPVEWFRTSVVYATYLAILCIVFAPFLFGGQLFTGSDITVQYYAAFNFYHHALTSGQSFLWSPLLFSGFPLYLSQVAGFFDPLNYLLFHFFDGYDGLHIRLVFDYFLFTLASYAAARIWGLSRAASFGVGLASLLPFNETFVSNPLFANSAFLMPFLIWILGRVRSCGGWSFPLAVFAGGVTGFAFLGGYAQIIIMYLTLFGIAGVIYALFVHDERLMFLSRFIGLCAVIGGVGFIVGSPQILPALEFTPLTRRGGGIDYALATLKAIDPGDFLLFLFPDYTYFPYVAVGRKALYVGAVWFLLALGMVRVAGHTIRRATIETKEAIVFGSVFLFALLTAFIYSPIFYVLQHLPVFDLFRFSDRWMYGGSFFLAMLGGYGLDALSRMSAERYMRIGYAIVSLPIVAFLVIIAGLNSASQAVLNHCAAFFIWFFERTLFERGPFVKDLEHYREATVRGLQAWQEFTSFKDISFLMPTLMLILALVVVWLYLYGKISSKRFVAGTLCLMVVTCITSLQFQFSGKISRSAVHDIESRSFMQFIPEHDRALYRYYPFMPDAGFRVLVPPTYRLTSEQISVLTELVFGTGWPNTNFSYQMPAVDGYDVFVPQQYVDVLTLLGSTFGAQDNTRNLSVEEKTRRVEAHADVLGMMNTKYVVSGVPLKSPSLILLGTYPISKWDIPEYVYENKLALPRAYIAKEAIEAPNETLPNLVQANKRNFASRTYLDCTECGSMGEGTIVSRRYENGKAYFIVKVENPSWLVFSESNLPGWRATLDGTTTAIVRANGLYMAVKVPKGNHSIEFIYRGHPY